MSKNYKNIDDLLDEYSKKYKIMNKKNIDYFLEIIICAMISKNTDVMRYIINYFKNENFIFNSDYKLFYLNFYYLMCTYYYRITNDKILEKKYLKRFSFNEIRYSYEDIAQIFLIIYIYSNETDLTQKNNIKDRYIKFQKKLNYNMFSLNYLNTYFSST
tara:strand:+ start:49 stop:525 length:477 start_codon:yes stop_codon:yes gene_type:complete